MTNKAEEYIYYLIRVINNGNNPSKKIEDILLEIIELIENDMESYTEIEKQLYSLCLAIFKMTGSKEYFEEKNDSYTLKNSVENVFTAVGFLVYPSHPLKKNIVNIINSNIEFLNKGEDITIIASHLSALLNAMNVLAKGGKNNEMTIH